MGSKVYRRQMCMSPVHREVTKTNGHSLSVPTSITPELQSTPRLGRPLNFKSHGTSRYFLFILFFFWDCTFVSNLMMRLWIFFSLACSLAQRTVVAPACTKKPSPSKWCKAQHTAPHLVVHTVPGNAVLRRRWVATPVGMNNHICWC